MNVTPVAQARAGLSQSLRRFRADPDAPPVVIGSHRNAEAVLVPIEQYRALTSARRTIDLERLRALAPALRTLARASHLTDVHVYGSVARGDQTATSDVDLLVTPEPNATLFDIAQFEMDIESILGVPVSAVSTAALDRAHDAQILDEAIPL